MDICKSESLYPNLMKICRLCLKEDAATINIFNSDEEVGIPWRIMTCTSLEINPSDQLPKLICIDCRIQLERSYYFRKKSQYSDQKLRKHLRLIKLGKKSHVFEKNNQGKDEDYDDDEQIDFTYSLNFLKAIEEEENLKREKKQLELEENLKEQIRVEETNRIFEEAKNFFNCKVSEFIKIAKINNNKTINQDEVKIHDLQIELNEKISESKENKKSNNINNDILHERLILQQEQPKGETDFRNIFEFRNNSTGSKLDNQTECLNAKKDVIAPSNKIILVDQNEREKSEINESSNKEFDFTYDQEPNDDTLDTYYLIKNSDDDEVSANDNTNQSNIDETTSNADNNEIDTKELNAEDEDAIEHIETIDLDDCTFDETMSNDVNMFVENVEDVENENLVEIEPSNIGDDEISNQSNLALVSVIQKSLLSQPNIKLNGNLKCNIEQVSNGVTHVKVKADDGSVLLLELQTEATEAESLIEKHVSGDNQELKIFKCTLCPQSFTRRTLLIRHQSVHIKNNGYSCKYCQKWFACKSSMDRHIRVHTGEKPFKCEECGRKFIQKEILKRHMVIHTGIRPYPCPHCEKAFVQRQLLRQHINLKHTENPVVEMHECFLCPKTFCHASGLSRHLLVHSGVSYNCKKCGKKFNDKSAVKRHTLTVHAHNKFYTFKETVKKNSS